MHMLESFSLENPWPHLKLPFAERGWSPAHCWLLQGAQRNDMYTDPAENIKIINETNNAKRFGNK